MADARQEAERAIKLLGDQDGPKMDYGKQPQLEDFVQGLIKQNLCATIGIKHEMDAVYITCVYPQQTKLMKFDNISISSYETFCRDLLKIDPKEQYNCCRTCLIEGVFTRVYAIMPPFTKSPNITISTTKQPPATLEKNTIPDEAWDEIVHSNFIILGPSGSGKTYLMNYLLSKYIKQTERLAIIEEFGELIPPNPLTISILVPPVKPGETHLLQFITQQANLMRLDMTCIGEVKGAEAWPLIVQGASGTRISCTIHGDNLNMALNRIKALCYTSCDNAEAIEEMIAKGIKYAITMKKRQIVRIEKLMGTHNHNNFAAQEIYS